MVTHDSVRFGPELVDCGRSEDLALPDHPLLRELGDELED